MRNRRRQWSALIEYRRTRDCISERVRGMEGGLASALERGDQGTAAVWGAEI